MSSESVTETTTVPRSSESFKLEFKKIRRKCLVASTTSYLLVCFVLLFLVQNSASVCVWEGSGGFKLACGFRQSGLFRIRSLGGLKGWAGAGFTVGDEDGFKDSLTNAESRKQHTARQQQLKQPQQQQPFWAQQPAQQQQANPLFSLNSATNQLPNFKLFALGSNINEQKEASPAQQGAAEVNRNGLQKRSSYWKWPMGLRGQNRNGPQRQGVPVAGPVPMQVAAPGGPMGPPPQRRRKNPRGRNPNMPPNHQGGMQMPQQYRPLMPGQIPQVPMMMPAPQPGVPLDAQQYQTQRQGTPFGNPGDQSATIPYGLKLLGGSQNYGTKFLVGQFMNGQNSGLDTGDQDEGFAVADGTKVGYDTNIFPDIYFTTTTPKDKLVQPDLGESEGTKPKTKLKKVRVIKNRGKDTKKDRKKVVVVEATSQEPSEESASISQETTTKMTKPAKPTSAEEVTERITSTTVRHNIVEDEEDPMDVSSWPDFAANLPDDDERAKMFKLLQSMGFKAAPPAAFPMPRTTASTTTTTTTTTTPAPVRNPLNPLITKGYDPRFPPDHPVNKAILESLTTTTTTTTPKPFYNQNGYYDPQKHFTKNLDGDWTGVTQHEKVGYVEMGSHETKNRMSQTKLYNNKFYDHYNKSSIQTFGIKPKVTDIYWLHAATTQSSLFPIPAVEPTTWNSVKDTAEEESEQQPSPAQSADEAFENFPQQSEDWPEVLRLPSQNSLDDWTEYSKDDRLGVADTSENTKEQSTEDAPLQISSTPAPEPVKTTQEPKQSAEERKPPRRVMIRRRFRTTTTSTTTTPAPTTEAETQPPKRRGHRRRYKVRTTTAPTTTSTTTTTTTTTTTPRVVTAVDTSYSWASADGQQYEMSEDSEEQPAQQLDQNNVNQVAQVPEIPEESVEVPAVEAQEAQVSAQNEESSEDAGLASLPVANHPNFYNHAETVQKRPQHFGHPQVIMPVEESEGDAAVDDEEPVKFYQVPHSQALKPGLPVEDEVEEAEEDEENDAVNLARPNNLVVQQQESEEDQFIQQQPETRKKQKKPTGLTKPVTQMVAPPPGQFDQTYIYDHKDQPAGDFGAPINAFHQQHQPQQNPYVFSTLGHAASQLPQQDFAPPALPAVDEQIVKQHADPFNLTQNAVPSQGMMPPPPSHYQMFGSYQEPQHQPTFPSVPKPRPGFKFPTIPFATLNPFTAFQKPQHHPKHNNHHGQHGHFGGFQRPQQGLPQPSPSGHPIQFQQPPHGHPQSHGHHQFMQPPQQWIPKPPQHQPHNNNNNPYFQLTPQQHQALLNHGHSAHGIPQHQHQQRIHPQQQQPQISEKMDKPDSDKETILKALEALSKIKPDLIETIVKEKLGGKHPSMPTKLAVPQPQQVTVPKILAPSPPPPKTEVKRVDTVSLSTDAISSLFGEEEEEEEEVVEEDEEPEKDAFQVQMEKLLKLKQAKEILMKQKQEEWDREQQLVAQMQKQIEQVKLKEQLAAAAASTTPKPTPVSPEFDLKLKLASILQQPNRNYTASQMETIKKILMLNHFEKTLKTVAKPSISPPIGSQAMNVIAPPSPNLANQIQLDALKRRLAQVNAQRLQPHMFSQRSDEADQAPNQIEEGIPQPPEPTPESRLQDFQNAFANMPAILALKALAMKKAQSIRPTPDVMFPQQARPEHEGIVSATPAVDLSAILASPSPIQVNFPQDSKWNEKPALTDVRNAPKSFYPGDSVLVVEFDNATTHHTDFKCEDQKHFPGLYADPDLSCQVFHLCAKTDQGFMRKSFRCPKATVFDQEVLRCNWSLYVDCPAASTKYHFNKYLSESFQFLRVLGEFSSSYKAQKSE